ncbi:hypothetical protein HID58_047063 [Brassica napus]|uniref:DUF223 domain-containing protein n=1 Tax=Brassica napus TaxID=3708 RepID=A0ABQ8AY56_BRANA|nr:hypothetical protein HID58_047063 [Brassica napus]
MRRRLVEVRLIRFWKAHNVNKGGELMGVDMLFVDGRASINVNRLNTFRQLLNEGALYDLSLFDVTRSSPNFRFTDAHVVTDSLIKPVSIEITEASSPSPTEIYRSERIRLLCKVEEIETDNVPSPAGDASDMAVFVSFNTAIAQLSNVRAAEGCLSDQCWDCYFWSDIGSYSLNSVHKLEGPDKFTGRQNWNMK